MKTYFIQAKSKKKFNKENFLKQISILPKNIAICYSIQFKENAEKVKGVLEEKCNITGFSQVLGCSKPKFSEETQAIVLIGEGKFHSVSLMRESGIKTYLYSNEELYEVLSEDVEKLEKKKRGAYLNFLNQNEVGILISTKPGQQRFENALKFKKSLKNKKSYLFLANDINISEFENFGLKSWLNTACPRMDLNSEGIINLRDLINLEQ